MIPASVTPITVTARYVKADGSPAAGSVRFQLSAPAAVPADKAMVPQTSVKAKLDDNTGAISVVLAASDDPDWAVAGLTYQVTERITGAELRTYNIVLPADAPGGAVDLASLAPTVLAPTVVAYVLAATVGAVGGPAGPLDVDGKLPATQVPALVAADVAGVETPDGAQDKADAAQAAAITDAAGKYAPVFPVAAPTGVAATDTAAIIAQANAASAQGGGIVALRSGTYPLSGPLPVLSGVQYVGVEPVIVPQNVNDGSYLGDMEWNYAGGTVLVGDGTFAAFEANAVDQASVSPTIGSTQISNAGIVNVGIDNVTYGIHIGATNIMGMVWGTLRNVYVRNASQWGVSLVNFQHCTIDNVRTCLAQNAQYYGNLLPKLTLMCGNSSFGELYNIGARDGRDNRLCRGIVFESGGLNAQLNELTVRRVQANQMTRALLSVTATFTSGSTGVAVPDGTKFAVGMPVIFTATGNGFTANQCYLIASVAGNMITLANDRVSAAIAATGPGTLTLESYGFPCMEVTRRNAGANVRSARFGQVDVEGFSTAALYVDGGEFCRFDVAEQPSTVHHGVVGRSARWTEFFSQVACNTDFDANSTSSQWFGQRGRIIGRELSGMWLDAATGSKVLAVGGGQSGQTLGDIHTRTGGFLYPLAGMGERIFPRDTAITLGGFNQGDIVFASAAAVTMTLPTIVTDTNVSTSHIGLWFEFYNVGTGALTVATDGTQTLNKVAGRTSVTVAPGNSLKVIAAKDNGGALFWLAKASTLVT